MYTQPYTYTQQIPLSLDDGHGDYNRSYERSDDDFDYADYSTEITTSVTTRRSAAKPIRKLLRTCSSAGSKQKTV